jgi:hypothetical protein
LAAASGAGEALRYDEWIAAQDPGHKHSKLWASDGSPEAVTVDAAGNVGIGTTSPGALLQVGGTDNAYRYARITSQAVALFRLDDNSNYDNMSLENRYQGQNYGASLRFNLGYGSSYDAVTAGRISVLQEQTWSSAASTQDSYMSFSTALDGAMVERMRITSAGNVGIGTTSPGYKLTCNGEPGANGYTAWTNYSDIRFKQNINPLNNNILAKVLKLNPVTFYYNNKNPWGEKPGERTLYGFIAQELQDLFPDMVGEIKGPDGEKYLTTNLSNLTLYLVQAIKEQQTQIELLRAKLN